MKRILSGLLSVLLILTALPYIGSAAADAPRGVFSDVPANSWYGAAVDYMHSRGFMNGTADDLFSPQLPVSRGMLMCILGVMKGVDKSEYLYSYFNDCTLDVYYTPYVTWAYDNGIAAGTGDKMFSPEMNVTREQIAVFVMQIMSSYGLDTVSGGYIPGKYTDIDDISEWAYEAVRCCIANGIISGVSETEISPASSCTRAQIAVIFANLHKRLLTGEYAEYNDFCLKNGVFQSKFSDISHIVTRAEYAETIVTYTGFADAVNYYGYQTDDSLRRFSDMKIGRSRAYAEIAESQGYMVCGDEFRPDDHITYSDLMRGLIWALGYREYADGADPTEYAGELGLDKNLLQEKDADAPVTIGEYGAILRTALFRNTYICIKNDDGTYRIEDRGKNCSLYNLYMRDYKADDLIHLANGGWDVFGSNGWRYGPSMMINDDGSIDMWLAGNAVVSGEVDWGYHQVSYDGGLSFTAEKASVCPTYASEDWNWCCDPAVFKLGDYYYAGYTSICWRQGYDNNLFIARSTDPDDFTSEKWNGSGWGGMSPKPAITFDGLYHTWGCGEPSFVVKDGTIYCYVTWTSDISMRKVYTAPADDPDWPGKLRFAGVSVFVSDPNEDSIDVKYADAYGQFIAVCTGNRMLEKSFIKVYASFDGITFRRENILVGESDNLVVDGIHNIGITGDVQGHIDINAQNYVCFAYTGPSDKWGKWHTRFVPITLIGGSCYGSEDLVISSETPSTVVTAVTDPDAPVRLIAGKNAYSFSNVGFTDNMWFYCTTQDGGYKVLDSSDAEDMTFIYDPDVVEINKTDMTLRTRRMKGTTVIVKYKGALTTLRVTPNSHRNYPANEIYPENETVVFTYKNEKKQNGIIATNGIGDYLMLWGGSLSSFNVYSNGLDSSLAMWKHTVIHTEYDGKIISISDTGVITARAPGTTEVICKYDGMTTSFTVIVPEEIFEGR